MRHTIVCSCAIWLLILYIAIVSSRHPHYDASKEKRALHGALEVSVRELLRVESQLSTEL